ncbi:BTAD domain-containing putative transcriptional regulator [Streptomyces sp. NPDC006984]|uniref:BTAD domain-containing putative transcriptional regulator n=1 Tax=Streptomyces sp. NPDC006984 TaxID=3155463 RepID=UPI0033C29CB3
MTLRYLVLGLAQARRADGGPAPLSGARLRALLTALAAAGGRPVAAADLADDVWPPDVPHPADAPAALQALVGRLRRALGPGAVATAPGGYRLTADPDEIDLFRFERLAAEGRSALDTGAPRRAAELLGRALALWQGPALADLPSRERDPLAARAERRRDAARRDRLAAEVALGRAEAALPDLAALASAAPLDEPLHALLLRALRSAGHPARALQEYEDLRSRLAERLGTDPGPELRRLHAELLAEDHRPTPAPLPRPLTRFIGRERELAALAAALEGHRLVTLTGPGGAGKTRLALEAARAAARAAHLVELGAVHERHDVAGAVLAAIGARPLGPSASPSAGGAPRDPLTVLVEECAHRDALLVLDNCEHVLDAAARLAETLLAACPRLTILATGREPLGVTGERVHAVGPLTRPEALRLLEDRGAAVRAGFSAAQDPHACAEICRRLDGLPLAVELAAARLTALTPRQIADRLDDRFRLLTGGGRTAPPRRRTLRAVVDWSWDPLTSDERRVLRRASVFTGGFGLAAAEDVCGPGTLDLLASLVAKSLVTATPARADGMRYGLLETIAEYAAEQLEAAGDGADARRRHLRSYRELARAGDSGLRGPRRADWLRRLEAEHGNLGTALRTAVREEDEQEALCLVLALSWFWQQSGHQGDARTWAPAAAALGPDPFAPAPPPEGAPGAAGPRVRPAGPVPDPAPATAPPWRGEVLQEARRGVHLIALAAGGAEGGGPERLRAVAAAYRPGLPQLRFQPASMWFFVRLMTGDTGSLAEAADAVVAAFDGAEGGWDLAFALLVRARLTSGSGAPDRAVQDGDRALLLFEAAGDPWGVAECHAARGAAHEAAGRHVRAAADFGRAADAAVRSGAGSPVPLFRARRAAALLRANPAGPATEAAEDELVGAAAEADRCTPEAAFTTRMLLALHYGATGRGAAARGELDRAGELLASAGPAPFLGAVAGTRAWLDCQDGEFTRALAHLADAVRRLRPLADRIAPGLTAGQLPCAAWALARTGRAADGARLLGAYDAHPAPGAATGFCPLPDGQAVRRTAERELRRELGERYTALHARGRALSVTAAADLLDGAH